MKSYSKSKSSVLLSTFNDKRFVRGRGQWAFKQASKRVNLKMLPAIKVVLPCFLLAIVAGGAKAFDFEPEGGWGQLWLNQTEPEGEVDQLGDLTVRRSDQKEATCYFFFSFFSQVLLAQKF